MGHLQYFVMTALLDNTNQPKDKLHAQTVRLVITQIKRNKLVAKLAMLAKNLLR